MEYDIQIIINLFATFMMIGFPISLVMHIGIKLIQIMQSFILGRDVKI